MSGPFLIGAIQFRVPVAWFLNTGLPLVGHDELRGAAEKRQRARMRPDPVRQTARPGGLGIGVVAGTQHGHEYVRRPALAR